MIVRSLFLAIFLLITPLVCQAQRPFEQRGIVILQTKEVFSERVSQVEAFEVYVKELVDAMDVAVHKLPESSPAGGFLVVAVKPGGRSRVWLDMAPELSEGVANAIHSASLQVNPMPVKDGVALFAIKISLWGGAPPKVMVPRPKEWASEAEKAGGSIELGDLVLRVWPN